MIIRGTQRVHIGDCPVMIWTRFGDNRLPILCQSWERFMTTTRYALAECLFVRPWSDPEARFGHRLRVTILCANGWADYRKVGWAEDQQILLLELVDSDCWPANQEGVDERQPNQNLRG